jgi:TRAP-type mannitol/chloroaromatic compound transport system permease small subunit
MARGAIQWALPRAGNLISLHGIAIPANGRRIKGNVLQELLRISGLIDRVTEFIGLQVRWLILAAVIVSAVNAIIRKAFDTSSNAWLELQWYLFGAVFMLAAAHVLQKNAHVRIDAVSSRLSKRTRDWIDLFGHIFFLLPICLLMVWLGAPFFWEALRNGEISNNAGGLLVWPTKFFVFAGFALLLAQACSEIIKRWAVIKGLRHD